MIAGMVISTGATLATRNVSHFDGLSTSVINPWQT
jgi:predicted nucleic acid-binding protein